MGDRSGKGVKRRASLVVLEKKGINWKTENKAREQFMYLLPLVENLEVGGDNKSWVLTLT